MKISIAADERLHLAEIVLRILEAEGHEATWHGPEPGGTVPWPTVARLVAEDIASGRAENGILMCWTGTGVCMAANKVKGVRAGLCDDAETARGAKLWNNANVLCLSMRRTSDEIAREILNTWFNSSYQPNTNDDACLASLEELDARRAA